jgi:hypothetical protein
VLLHLEANAHWHGSRLAVSICRFFCSFVAKGFGDRPRHFFLLEPLTAAVIQFLEPSDPAMRKEVMPYAGKLLRLMVNIYPMCAFHQSLQIFAVSSCTFSDTPTQQQQQQSERRNQKDEVSRVVNLADMKSTSRTTSSLRYFISLFDVRTATKWQTFSVEGFPSAICFDQVGNMLSAYIPASSSSIVMIWQWAGFTGLFGGMLRSVTTPVLTHELPPTPCCSFSVNAKLSFPFCPRCDWKHHHVSIRFETAAETTLVISDKVMYHTHEGANLSEMTIRIKVKRENGTELVLDIK